jgi:hypothetical protein
MAANRFSRGAVIQLATGEYSTSKRISSKAVEIFIPAILVLLNQDRTPPTANSNSIRSLGLAR